MKYNIDQEYKANANAFTCGIITLLMLGFAAFAQSQELKTNNMSTITESPLCVEFVPSLCQQLNEIHTQTFNPLFLIQ
ncbi:MAG: hypothetical protein ACI9CE_002550 [Flavobacterium sp.]|jgi:hypothetical protein